MCVAAGPYVMRKLPCSPWTASRPSAFAWNALASSRGLVVDERDVPRERDGRRDGGQQRDGGGHRQDRRGGRTGPRRRARASGAVGRVRGAGNEVIDISEPQWAGRKDRRVFDGIGTGA
jgi:hypothetical protein